MLKLCYEGYYNRNANSDLKGQQVRNKLGLIFWSNLHSNHLQEIKCYPRSKEGNMHIQISSQILKPFFRKLSGSFAIWGGGARIAHLPEEEEKSSNLRRRPEWIEYISVEHTGPCPRAMALEPTNTCPTQTSNGRCLGYVESHANF